MRILFVFMTLFAFFSSGVLLGQSETGSGSIVDRKGVGGYNITAFDRIGHRSLGGYYDTEWISDSSQNSFRQHRVILVTSAQLHERLLFNAEVEYEYGGLINNGTNDGELKIEQAWLDYKILPELTFRSGLVLVPFGLINILHDSDIRETTNRPIYARNIVPTTWMDTGLGFHGVMDITDDAVLNYEAYIINGLSNSITETDGLRKSRPSFKKDNNRNKAFVGHVGFSPYLGLDVGTSYYTGKYDASDLNTLSMVGLDTLWKWNEFEVMAEFASASVEGATGSIPSHMNGYYVEGRYRFFPDFLKKTFLAEGFRNPIFTLFSRYSVVDPNTAKKNVNDVTQITVGMNYRPTQTVVFKLEYEINREAENEIDNNQIAASVAVGF